MKKKRTTGQRIEDIMRNLLDREKVCLEQVKEWEADSINAQLVANKNGRAHGYRRAFNILESAFPNIAKRVKP